MVVLGLLNLSVYSGSLGSFDGNLIGIALVFEFEDAFAQQNGDLSVVLLALETSLVYEFH